MESREPHYCSRCALDKICEIHTFDRCLLSIADLAKNHFLACGNEKKKNWITTTLFWTHVS